MREYHGTSEQQIRLSALAYFDEVWRTLADKGQCDGIGGAEYRRVRHEYGAVWYDVGTFDAVAAFIRAHAR